MSSSEFNSDSEGFEPLVTKKANKKLSVERIYQKKTQLEHILLRPDTYIGSIEVETKQMWVFDEDVGMQLRDVSYVPGLYKIFDEVLVNAADNKQRDKTMSSIRIDINPDKNEITIFNNGKGIPVIEHKDEKMYVPTLIFGHLLTSSNYDDKEKKVVGGRNGYGAKLCNIFSKRFKVETSCKEYNKAFSQVWTDNMNHTEEPRITQSKGEDYTRVTFEPDLSKFNMTRLDKDIVAIFSRRAYDVAGSTKGVKVFLNGQRLPVHGFKDYVELFLKDKEDDIGGPLKIAHEVVNERWEIAVTVSDKGFQQNSFVNGIATTRGGKHVDYVADQIVAKMTDIIKKKNKAGINVKPFQIRNHLWVFVNCLIENPTFDSQTKDTMTLQSKSFGSTCNPSDKFFVAVNKVGVVESIMSWVQYKAQTELSKKCHSKKHAKLSGIPKLEDANDAGTKNSIDCTLILTEGDSAKSLVVAGFGVVGRDKYGVFPLRGKMLNVREATHKQILENAEINNLIKIMGLQYKKKYTTTEDLKTLRYGKLMIMTDQDQDGSHIKGLLINFIHHNWPSLLKLNFLEEFITPIVKVSKGNQFKSFYSLPEFEEWKTATNNWSSWKVKYYKGLGTSTSSEAKEYFSQMRRHRVVFKYDGPDDDRAVELAFSKKMIEQRKDWLTNGMEERKRRRDLGLSEIYLYESNTTSVSYKDFVNKELILFSNMDNERSIPSLMDGLKPGQRKVIFTCFKRNDKREVKVAQLAGSVGEHSAYHHGEASLMSTIVNLAQNFVGSNNINLLQPIGQFGTRLQGGKDAASARYIFTMLSPLARKIFPALDDPLLNSLYDDNLKIEPEYYVPIIPMVLVNGAEGIGTGWSTKIPNYNPREIVENIRRMIRGEDIVPMKPWYKGYRGSIVQIDRQRFVVNGEIALLDEKSFEITELPIKCWTQAYKESTLEILLHGNEKTPSLINDYKEYHTESTVRFVIALPEDKLRTSLNAGIHKIFKLQSPLSITSMVLFDHNGCLKRYESPEEIIREFFPVRLEFYVKRKAYYEGMLEAEALKLQNQARFILEKIDGTLVMENVKKAQFLLKLIERKFDSDPVKGWKIKNGISTKDSNAANDSEANEQEPTEEEDTHESTSASAMMPNKYDFDYLFDMAMRSMLSEKVEQLLKQRDTKKDELERLKRTSPQQLWEEDLNVLLEELQVVEEHERMGAISSKPIKITSKGASKPSKSKTNKQLENSKPSDGERVEPKIDIESYRKPEKVAKKANNNNNKKKTEGDNSDELIAIDSSDDGVSKPLSERIGNKLNDLPKAKPKPKAKASKPEKKKSIDSDSDTEEENLKSKTSKPKNKKPVDSDSEEKKSKSKNSKPKKKSSFDSDSEENIKSKNSKPKKKRPIDLDSGSEEENIKSKKSNPKKKKAIDSDSEEENPRKTKSKKLNESIESIESIELDDSFEMPSEPREKSGRVRQRVNYNFDNNSTDDEIGNELDSD